MGIQIGIRLHDTEKLPLWERLDVVKQQGFSCAHLALSKVIEGESVENGGLTPGFAMFLKRLFWEKGVDIAVLGCYLNLATPHEEKFRKNLECYLAHIRFAAHLNCGVVGTETGAPNTTYSYDEACHTEEALEIFVDNLRPVVKYAEQMGVLFAIEPVFKHIVWNPKQARKVLDMINSPNLRIILDPVNLLDISNYKNQREIIQEALDLLGEDIAVVHIKDFILENGALKSVAAGTGDMNYTDLLRYLKEKKPYVHVTLENTTPQNAVVAREYIEKIWESI